MSLDQIKTERPVESFSDLNDLIGQTISCCGVRDTHEIDSSNKAIWESRPNERFSGPLKKLADDQFSISDANNFFIDISQDIFIARQVKVEE